MGMFSQEIFPLIYNNSMSKLGRGGLQGFQNKTTAIRLDCEMLAVEGTNNWGRWNGLDKLDFCTTILYSECFIIGLPSLKKMGEWGGECVYRFTIIFPESSLLYVKTDN